MQVTCRSHSLHIVVVGQVEQGELVARCCIVLQKLFKVVEESVVLREVVCVVDQLNHPLNSSVKIRYNVGRHNHTVFGMVELSSSAWDGHGQHCMEGRGGEGEGEGEGWGVVGSAAL